MKTKFLSFVLLLAFAEILSAKTPKNVIIMIGDGMGVNQVQAALTANGGHLNMTNRCPVMGLRRTDSANSYITDSAAGGTAISSGEKTNNGMVGVKPNGDFMQNILELAKNCGRSTGVVASCSVTHATPASFVSHQPSRSLDEDIAADFAKADIDVFIGGGKKAFENRKDERNISEELRKKGFQVVYTLEEAKQITSGKLGALVTEGHLPTIKERDPNYLSDASMAAINVLKNNKKGFALMIEGSQIDWGGHANDQDYMVNETLDFDRAIGKVLDFAEADGNTLVIITADHETGGVSIKNGNYAKKEVTVDFTSKDHTASPVPFFVYGPGSEKFQGFLDNTSSFGIIQKVMKLK